MSEPSEPPVLRPVPGTARGRGRTVVDLAAELFPRPTRRRAGVMRRALRRELSRLHDRRRILAMALLTVSFAMVIAGLAARGDAAGADARAYWAGVRIWLEGGDPYHPVGPFLPYVYAPWMLPLFAPWALLPWDAAWFLWRGSTILLLLWSIRWAYARRPLATAVLVALLTLPIGANLDTGNINLLLALAVFGAAFVGPRLGGFLFALAAWMKWFPAVLWLVLKPRTRIWGLFWVTVAALLSLATLPLTIVQLETLFGFGPRPLRIDYLVFIWAAVPWWWQLRDPFAFLRPGTWRRWSATARGYLGEWRRRFRTDPVAARLDAGRLLRARVRSFLGLGAGS